MCCDRWGGTAQRDIEDAAFYIANIPAIIVHPQGYADNSPGKWWGSWHAAGTGESPGSAGPTCEYGNPSYCYESCASRPQGCDPKGCDWASGYDKCDDEKFAEFILTVDGICYEDDTTSYKYELNDCVSTGM